MTSAPDLAAVEPSRQGPARADRPLTWVVRRRVVVGLFLLVFGLAGLAAGGHSYSVDDEIKFETTRSLMNLDGAIEQEFPNFPQLYRERPDGSLTSVYGIGQSVAGMPFYAVGRILAVPADDSGADVALRTATFLTNAAIGGLTAVFVMLLARELGASRNGSLLLALSYALGTYAFQIFTTYHSEPGTALLVTAGCWLAFRARRTGDAWTFVASGAAIGAAALFRVSAVSFLPIVGLYVLVGWPRPIPRRVMDAAVFSAGAVGSLLVLAATNLWRYGDALEIGYESVDTTYPVVQGMVNIYLSPGKSLFLYAPVAIVSVLGAIWSVKRLDGRALVLVGIVLVNSLTIARLPVWSGDHAWGPRYMQVVLPLVVALGAWSVDRMPWRRLTIIAGVLGALIPATLGVLVNYDVLFIDAIEELGTEGVPDEKGQPRYSVEMHHGMTWNPILGHFELLPAAVRDVLDARRADEPARGPYSPEPLTHYGYFGSQPRLDVWWLWVEPTDGSRVTYVLLVPLLAAVVGGGMLLRPALRRRDVEPALA